VSGEGIVRTLNFAIGLTAVLVAGTAFADEQVITLKPGAGMDKVEANCQACHSLAYIPMNSPFLKPAAWDAEIAKMITVMGAPIDDADAKAIGDYLKANYGG
jgi:mono/diheme cytochrome c family protein